MAPVIMNTGISTHRYTTGLNGRAAPLERRPNHQDLSPVAPGALWADTLQCTKWKSTEGGLVASTCTALE